MTDTEAIEKAKELNAAIKAAEEKLQGLYRERETTGERIAAGEDEVQRLTGELLEIAYSDPWRFNVQIAN